MIVNRYILKEVISEDRLIKNILVRAVKFGIVFDLMTRDRRGHTISAVHFDINKLIDKQDFWTNIVKENHHKKNKDILKLMIDARNKLNKNRGVEK